MKAAARESAGVSALKKFYWTTEHLVLVGIFSALIRLSSLAIGLVGGGPNPVSLFVRNGLTTALLIVLVCRVRPPLREHAPPAFKRRREKHMRPAAAQNIRAQSGKSGPQNPWRCGRYPFVTQISLFVSEFLFSCMRLCSDTRSNVPSKAQAAFYPACIRGTFSYFTAPSFNLYIGPPSYFVSFRKSDLYIPVPPFARLPSRARLSMLDFGPLRTPSV